MVAIMNLFYFTREQLMPQWQKMIEHCSGLSQWTSDSELAWLAEAASTRKLIAEVGSYKGKSAKAMAWGCPGVIHCIDHFQDKTLENFKHNLATELASGKVVVHELESEAGAKQLGNWKFDMIFIDGSHAKEDVIRDIMLWKPLLAPLGLLCGHDCWPEDPVNGVFKALKELKLEFSVVMDSIWAVKP
jgi:hypothetical protein